MMRRLPALLLMTCLFAGAAWACDGDDDDPSPTPTSPAASSPTAPAGTSTTAPSGSPTIEAGIVVEQPLAGNVRSPIEMFGRANVFEAALTIDALNAADDSVLCMRHVQATAGTGTEGTWAGVLAIDPPDTETQVTLRAYTFSPRDGSIQDLVETGVILSTEDPDIVINAPACASSVSGTLTVEGMALVFEAALQVDIRDASGTAVMTNNVMAADGTQFSFWSTTFDISGLTPGFYDVVAYNHSARDGTIENEFPVQISVEP
jgi:hypothetical protein